MSIVNGNLDVIGQLRNLKPENVTADPAQNTLVESRVWYNSTEKAIKFFNGTDVLVLATGGKLDEYLKLSGGTLTGDLVLAGPGTADLHPASFKQLTDGLATKQPTITGAASTIDTENLAAGKVLVSDGTGKVAVSDAVNVEQLGYLSEVTSSIQDQLDSKQATLGFAPVNKAGDTLTGNLDFGGAATVTNLRAPQNPTDAVRQVDIDNLAAGLDFQADVLGVQVDDTLVPTTDETIPDEEVRYIVTNAAALNAAFGTIEGLGDNDIIESTGTGFRVAYDVSAKGPGALAWNRAAGVFMTWDGTTWRAFAGLAALVAGSGLAKDGNTLNVKYGSGTKASADGVAVDANASLQFVDPTSGEVSTAADALLAVRLNGATLALSNDGVNLKDAAVTAAKLAASVAGNGILGGAGTALAVKPGNATIVVDADGVKIGDLSEQYLSLSDPEAVVTGQVAFPVPTASTSATPKSYVDAAVQDVADDVTALQAKVDGNFIVFDGTATAQTSFSIQHNLGNKYQQVSVVDENDQVIIPDSIRFVDANNLTVTLAEAAKIRVIISGKKVAA